MKQYTPRKQTGSIVKPLTSETIDPLHGIAFENSGHATIITTTANRGNIIMANKAVCNLLGYSKKELLTKHRKDIFSLNDSSFKKMMAQRNAEGNSKALVIVFTRSGEAITCEITSALFNDENGIEHAITTLTDRRSSILAQKELDIKKEKIVGDNIILAQKKSDAALVENNEWIKYIAETSYDVMWDWDVESGEIYVGDSIKEVFGYKVKNNRTRFSDFTARLLPGQKDSVERKILETMASDQKNWNDSFIIRRRDGSEASVTSRACIIRNEDGQAKRLIGAMQDVSRTLELEQILEGQIVKHKEDSEKFLLASKLSFDVIWDWDLSTNKVFMGDGYEDLFGYKIENNKGIIASILFDHLHPDHKKVVEKSLETAIASSETKWEHSYRFERADGSFAKVFNRASIVRHADGKAYRMIGALKDISKQKLLEERLEQEIATRGNLLNEYKESFKFVFNLSSDVFFDSDMLTNQVMISDAYEKEFGYKINNNMSPLNDWISHIHPDDQEAVYQDYNRMLESKDIEWKYNYRFLRSDNSVANVLSSGMVLRNINGKAYRMIGYMQDSNKKTVLEEGFNMEIKLKEKQITEAKEEARETERSDIGKELHDNVNQLLGASKLYLDMAKRGGEHSEMYLSRSSEYTNTAIEEIRKLTRRITYDPIRSLGLCEAIGNVARDTMEVNPVQIICEVEEFEENSVNEKFKLNIFRIIQEQLNNIIKHAKASQVRISLFKIKNTIILSIGDNGVGFDTSQKQKGIGIANIKSRAASYSGIANFVSLPGHGCVLTVTFPAENVDRGS